VKNITSQNISMRNFMMPLRPFMKREIISALIHIHAQGNNVYILPIKQQDDETTHATNN
jgi:hypothetical protein